MDKFSQLRAAGFNDTEIQDYLSNQSSKLLSAGFSQQEVASYLGAPPPPNDAPIMQYFRSNLDKATTPGEDGQRKPLDFMQAIEAGFGMSVTGLAAKGKLPEKELSGKEDWYNRIAYSAAQMIGDTPANIAGFVMGAGAGVPTGPGAVATGMGGAFALPAGLRSVMVDAYSKGEFKDFSDFFTRASGILLDTAKGYVTGAATAGAGMAAGKLAAGASAPVRSVSQLSAEIGTMTTVGAALEGHVPSAQDFMDAGVLLLGAKGAIKAGEVSAAKLREVYKKTGVPPAQVVADAKTDPTIVQDMATGRDIPRAYEPYVDPMFKPEVVSALNEKTPGAAPDIAVPTSSEQVTTQRQALVKMAENLGIEVREVDGNFHSSASGYVAVPAEGAAKLVPGITDAEFVFAHELGHAIMQRRGALFGRERQDGYFSFWSNAKLQREISNWPEFTEASKEMRPDFWNNPELGQQKYVRTPDELIADTVASVLTGKRDISILYPLMNAVGMKPEGLGLASGGGAGGGRPPGSFPEPAAGGPEPGSLAEAQATILSKVSIGGKEEKAPLTFEKFYTAALDDLTPIKNAVKDITAGADVPANADPYVLARLTRGVYGKAQQALENATFDFATLKNNGKSLKDVLEPVKGDLNGLRAYAIASRALELKDRYIVSGFDVDAAAKVVKESGEKFEPVMRELVDYQNRITAYLRDSGVLSEDAYAAMLEANKNYVPFYRMLEDAGTRGAGGGLQVKNPIKQIKGSGLDVVDPLESVIKNTYTYLTLADRNAATKAFYDLAAKSDTPDAFFEKQPPSLRATKVTDEEMTRFLKENGIDKMPEDALTVFRAVRQPLAKDEIAFFENGKRVVLKVDPMLAEAFNAVDRQSTGMLMQFLAAPARALRAGSTLSPDFMVRNFVRDQFSAFVNSKVGFVPIYDTLRGVASIVKKDGDFQNWLKSGGANATLVALDRRYIQSEIFKLTGENPDANFLDKTWNLATKPIDYLRITSEFIENATRIGEFKRAKDATDRAAILEAGMASREITLDFARMGTQMRGLNMITAFLNSQVQGVEKPIRSITENPLPALAKIGVGITLPSVLLWMANHDDPRWEEIPAWQRDLFWIVMTKDNIYRIPKPFELGVIFGSSVERMLDALKGQLDPRDMKEFLKTFGGGFVPNIMPTVAAPVLEQVTNYSFFSGHDLVPSYLEDKKTGVLPEYRYSEYTMELTKALGHIVGTVPGVGATSTASPIVIENYIRSWTGGLGTYALQAADAGLRKAGVLPDPVKPEATLADIPVVKAFVVRYPSATAESIQQFREDFSKRSQYFNTVQTLAKQGDFTAAMKIMQMDPQAMVKLTGMDKAIGEMNQTIRLVYKNPDIPADQKRQIIDATYYNMIQTARYGNQMLKQIDDALDTKKLSQ